MPSRLPFPLRRPTALAALVLALAWCEPAPAAPGHSPRGRRSEPPAAPAQLALRAPKFSNRVAPGVRVEPSATGFLPEVAPGSGAHRAIQLTAGYTLVPGAGRPRLPADLARVGAAPALPAGRSGYLVQFGDASPGAARERIERAGGTPVAPLEGGTWLVRMDGDARARLAGSDGAPWVEAWEPAYKLSPRIDRAAGGSVEVTALLFGDGDVDATATALGALGATRVRRHAGAQNRLVRFELDPARVAEAAALPDVAWIEPAPRDSLFNDRAEWVVQTGVTNSRRMWDAGLRGAGQIVMSSDSGIRTNHMMFYDAAHDITGFGHYPDHRKVVAYLPGADIPEIMFGDEASSYFHGSHTAGTIAGNDDPNASQPYDGVAKDAKLWFMDLAGPAANGGIYPPDDLNDLFLPSYLGNAAGAARLSSNSWGSPANGAYTLSSMQVDQFMWNHPDYLIAFANGNDAFPGAVGSPATAKNCLSVGGTGNGDQLNWIYYYTSRGPTDDLRRKPTVCAPGEDVVSSIGNTRYAYSSYSGTSMATPAATGGLAIVRQYLAEGWYPTGAPVLANAMSPSAALLKAIAINAAKNDVLGYMAPDQNVGWGRLTLDDALFLPGDTRRMLLVDATDGLLDRQFVEYQVRVADPAEPLEISLCWTDAPGNPLAVTQIVNDLDLVVTNGVSTYLGNRFANGTSRTGGSHDSLNVEEGVRIANPAAGLWTVRVEAHRVAIGPQPFALCATGAIAGDGGAVALDRFDYALNDTLEIEVLDTDATAPVTVVVTSPSEPGGETRQLTGANGIYRGTLRLAPVPAWSLDQKLSVSSGDVLTVSYTDATTSTTLTASANVNVQAPLVTDVHARALDPTSALVTWTTDIGSTSRVRFGDGLPLESVAEASGLANDHAVVLTGLQPGQLYLYDVESVSRTGSLTCDSLGGAHRTLTTQSPGQFALVLGDTAPLMLDTWMNALAALGWETDILAGAVTEPPLVGGPAAGLRRYAGVMWQVDPNHYPPFSDAQRAAVDSLVEGGGRLLVTGHDIGYALSDATASSYTPEREAWLEQGLKARYYYDNLVFYGLTGTPGDPASGAYAAGIPYYPLAYGMAGDIIVPAPGTDGVGTINWSDDADTPYPVGLRWESNAAKGSPGTAFWGGANSRLVDMFYEWSCIGSLTAEHESRRTGVLESSMAWLLGRRAPRATIVSPGGGEVVTGDFLPIRFSIQPDSGRTVTSRALSYSPDDGATWQPLTTVAWSDSGAIWDLGAALGGMPVPNSARVLVGLTVTDDGSPPLRGVDVTDAAFTLARPGGDSRGPVAVAGSVRTNPAPLRRGSPATLYATFSDAETGGGGVSAAEFSWGDVPQPPGAGSPMDTGTEASVVEASAEIPTASLPAGVVTLWVRARDAAGNWGPAAGLPLSALGDGVTAVGDVPAVDFMAPPSPNPFRGSAAIRFGLSRAGDVRLELFDLAGRRVRTLANGSRPAGAHGSTWDGRDDEGRTLGAGIYFVRLVTPAGSYRSRLVSLP